MENGIKILHVRVCESSDVLLRVSHMRDQTVTQSELVGIDEMCHNNITLRETEIYFFFPVLLLLKGGMNAQPDAKKIYKKI